MSSRASFTRSVARSTWFAVCVALGLSAALATAQTPDAQAAALDGSVRAVRTLLAHGAVDEARKLVDKAGTPPRAKAIGTALVAIYEGRDDAAPTSSDSDEAPVSE